MISYNAVIEGALNGGRRCCCYIYSVGFVLETLRLYSEVTLCTRLTRKLRYYPSK